MLPTFSVVTPSYNQGAFLERTICSVLDQNYARLQYMVIDAGSTDGSVEIIHKYARHLAYSISEPDRGQVDAINKGLRRATGEIFAWLNSDDTYAAGALAAVGAAYRESRGGAAIYGKCDYIDGSDRFLHSWPYVDQLDLATVVADNLVPQPSCFIPMEIARRVGPLNDRLHFAFDYEYWIRILLARYRLQAVPQLLSNFRIHDDSKTQTHRRRFDAEMVDVHRRLLAGTDREHTRSAVARAYRRFASEHYFWFDDPHESLKFFARMILTDPSSCDLNSLKLAGRSLIRQFRRLA